MAEYTRDIQQLQKTASQQPQFAPPSQSLGGDIVNLVGTGLDFYAKNKAQEKLEGIAQRDKAREDLLNTTSLKIRQGRLEMKDQMSSTGYLTWEQSQLKGLPPALRAEAISRANKLTGETAYSYMDKQDKAIKLAADNRKTMEIDAVTAANKAGISIDPTSMTEQELHRYSLKGAEFTARQANRMAEYAENSAKTKDVNEKRDLDTKAFEDIGITDFVSNLSVTMGNGIRELGGFNPSTAPDVVNQLQELKSTVRNRVYSEYVRNARENLNLYVSQESIDKMISSGEAAIDAQIEILTNEAGIKAIQNNTGILFEGSLLKMAGSTDPNAKAAAMGLLSANYSKTPALLNNWDIHATFVADAMAGKVDVNDKAGMNYTAKSLSPIDPMRSPERYDYVDSVLEGMLDGTPTQQKAVVQSGSYEEILTQLSEEGSIIVAPESKELQAERTYKTTSKVLAATIANINVIKSYEEAGNQYASNFQSNPNQYSLDLSNGNFKLVASYPNQQPLASVKTFNRIVDKQIKAFKELGMSEDYIDNFKRDVMTSMSISPTERTN